jgi:predicted glycoside hydrolase/deacetylase ChbG (UPF0249 family)
MSAPAQRRRRTLCVTADDLGYSSARDAGILACAARRGGLVTRASVLVTGASAAAACTAAMAAGLPLGLHLNLSEGAPAASPLSAVSSLVDSSSGRMRGKLGLRDACAAGAVVAAHVEAEVAAQLDLFARLCGGDAPAHVDGHQHVHVIPLVRDALLRVLGARSLRLRTRVPALLPPAPRDTADAENAAASPSSSATAAVAATNESQLELVDDPGGARRAFYEAVSRDAEGLRAALRDGARGSAARAFVGFSTMGAEGTEPRARAALRRAFAVAEAAAEAAESCTGSGGGDGDGGGGGGGGSGGGNGDAADGEDAAGVEWMVHPGLRTPEGLAPAEAGCGGAEADDFARSAQREMEMRALAPGAGGRCALREWVEQELGARLVA